MSVNLDEVYEILRLIIRTKDTITYQDLSDAYFVRTSLRVGRRDWSEPLYAISGRCTAVGLPPISSVVVRGDDGMPGDGYWGIPGAPSYKDWNAWKAVLQTVYTATWPVSLP